MKINNLFLVYCVLVLIACGCGVKTDLYIHDIEEVNKSAGMQE